MSDERLDASRWFWYSALVEEAGLNDIERLSGSVQVVNGIETFRVRSKSLGMVALGSISTAEILAVAADLDDAQVHAYRLHVRDVKNAVFDPVADYARDLMARQRAPLDAVSEKKQKRKARALEMHATGRSVSYIAQKLGIHRRTVQRYLAEPRSATDRGLPL